MQRRERDWSLKTQFFGQGRISTLKHPTNSLHSPSNTAHNKVLWCLPKQLLDMSSHSDVSGQEEKQLLPFFGLSAAVPSSPVVICLECRLIQIINKRRKNQDDWLPLSNLDWPFLLRRIWLLSEWDLMFDLGSCQEVLLKTILRFSVKGFYSDVLLVKCVRWGMMIHYTSYIIFVFTIKTNWPLTGRFTAQ